jgi:formate hydrogenlyase transcriptional activator
MHISALIGSSPKFQSVLENVQTVAPVSCAVLIQGETGTGKEMIAQAIHDASPRRQHQFVAINCAAIPAALLESELFGHERGAFTGAVTSRMGRLQAADRGTRFLDEIGELPIELQPKLLRALQEQEFERLGSAQSTRVDVRIVAATNQNLEQMVAERRFRMDLYYRLNVFPITIPPLRERAEDIPLFVAHFVRTFAERQGKSIEHIPGDVMTAIESYNWPGNIRELQNFIERSVVLTSGTELRAPVAELTSQKLPDIGTHTLADAERAHIIATQQSARRGRRLGEQGRRIFEQPAKLSGRKRIGPACFEREAFKRAARQIRPLRFQSLRDVLRQFKLDLHGDLSLSQGHRSSSPCHMKAHC